MQSTARKRSLYTAVLFFMSSLSGFVTSPHQLLETPFPVYYRQIAVDFGRVFIRDCSRCAGGRGEEGQSAHVCMCTPTASIGNVAAADSRRQFFWVSWHSFRYAPQHSQPPPTPLEQLARALLTHSRSKRNVLKSFNLELGER